MPLLTRCISCREMSFSTVELKDGPLRVLPLRKFLTQLARGNVLGDQAAGAITG